MLQFRNVSKEEESYFDGFKDKLRTHHNRTVFLGKQLLVKNVAKELDLKLSKLEYSNAKLDSKDLKLKSIIDSIEEKFGSVNKEDDNFRLNLEIKNEDEKFVYYVGIKKDKEIYSGLLLNSPTVMESEKFKETVKEIDQEIFEIIKKAG